MTFLRKKRQRHFIHAYSAMGTPFIGLAHGQMSLVGFRHPEETWCWAILGLDKSYPDVYVWTIEDADGNILHQKLNPNYKETTQ